MGVLGALACIGLVQVGRLILPTRCPCSDSLYQVLKAPENSSPLVLEAYYHQARQDAAANPERLRAIEKAYHVLSNPTLRAAYDYTQTHRRLPAIGTARPDHPDYFTRLGLNEDTFSKPLLKNAYLYALIDNAEDFDKLLALGEAYETLENREERLLYLQGRASHRITETDRLANGVLERWRGSATENLPAFLADTEAFFDPSTGTKRTVLIEAYWNLLEQQALRWATRAQPGGATEELIKSTFTKHRDALSALNPRSLTPGAAAHRNHVLNRIQELEARLKQRGGFFAEEKSKPPHKLLKSFRSVCNLALGYLRGVPKILDR